MVEAQEAWDTQTPTNCRSESQRGKDKEFYLTHTSATRVSIDTISHDKIQTTHLFTTTLE